MAKAIGETERRRKRQEAYNAAHGITPVTIVRPIDSPLAALVSADYVDFGVKGTPRDRRDDVPDSLSPENAEKLLGRLRKEMKQAASKLEFERAGELRDRIRALESAALEIR
jgi:excinuclease ABC subunit B